MNQEEIKECLIIWGFEILRRMGIIGHGDTYFSYCKIIEKIVNIYPGESSDDYHLIAAACLWISLKFNGDYYWGADYMIIEIMGEKFTKEDLIACEILVLKSIKYKISRMGY